MKKLGIFDIDGVVYEGHSIFDLIRDQEKTKYIKSGLWKKIEILLDEYKKGTKSYKQAADEMLSEYSKSLQGKKYIEVLGYNTGFLNRNKAKIFPYFNKKFISTLKDEYDLYFVTTNFDFTAEAFMKSFNFIGFLSSKVDQKDGIISGQVELSLGGNKGIISDLIKKYEKPGSFAVGDSENDADMLELVEKPFVIEPDEKLKKIAKDRNWKVVNRDSITENLLSLL